MSKIAEVDSGEKSSKSEIKRTKAEIAFLNQQEKMVGFLLFVKNCTYFIRKSSFWCDSSLQQEERIKKKAAMTHKQRVEEFNKHLDSLTEHFDIPKVSWTK